MNTINHSNYPTDTTSRFIYMAGGISASIFLMYSLAAIILLLSIDGGYPQTASECFEMLAHDRFIGLLRLDILTIIVMPFYYILFFSIHHTQKIGYEIISSISLFCVLAGVTIFLSGVNISSIVILSDKFHSTTSTELRQHFLAAGEAMLATDMWVNTGSVFQSILIETGALFFSILMLKTNVFNTFTAWVGIITHGFDLGSVFVGLFVPEFQEVFLMVAGPLYLLWFPLIGIRFYQIALRANGNGSTH